MNVIQEFLNNPVKEKVFAFDFDDVIAIPDESQQGDLHKTFVKVLGFRKARKVGFRRSCHILKVNPDDIIKNFIKLSPLNPRIFPVFRAIKNNPNTKIVIATNNTPEIVIPYLKHYNLSKYIDEVYAPENFNFTWKPKEEYFERMVGELNVPKENVVFIDDQQANIVSSKNYGITSYLYPKGGNFSFIHQEL